MMTWQPIDTAPKDASWIIVLVPSGNVHRAHWASDLSGEEHPAFQGWFIHRSRTFFVLGEPPTHWIPMPDPLHLSVVERSAPRDEPPS
jgi:hypothetical protein